jgi:hypothetical protein
MSSDKHSGSCLGYICTCDELVKTLRAENARYREALEIVAEGEAHPLRYYQLRDLAREALKGE